MGEMSPLFLGGLEESWNGCAEMEVHKQKLLREEKELPWKSEGSDMLEYLAV